MITLWAGQWRQAGVAPGDTLLLHSSISRTLKSAKFKVPGISPTDLLHSFLEALGPHGTLLVPLFNFDFTRGIAFDLKVTPSQMGALTEACRQHPQALRTRHPLYSFAVIGPQRKAFADLRNKSGYGEDSPFALLRKLNGKIAVLDLDDQNSMTFYHHVEEMEKVTYRYFKSFTAPYSDGEQLPRQETFTLFVRDLERGVKTDVNRMGEYLWLKGAYTGDPPLRGNGLRVISAPRLFELTQEVIRNGEAEKYLYSIDRKT